MKNPPGSKEAVKRECCANCSINLPETIGTPSYSMIAKINKACGNLSCNCHEIYIPGDNVIADVLPDTNDSHV